MQVLSPPKKLRLLAVCHDCSKKHGISLDELLHTNAIRDWEVKHSGHRIEFLDPEAYDRSIASHAVHEYRHNADIKLAHGASVQYTITLNSVADSASRLTGTESSSVSNTSNLYLDYLVAGQVMTGTTPTANEYLEVCAVAALNDTPTWPDVFDGTASAETITNATIKAMLCRTIALMSVTNTSSVAYPFGPVSLAQLYGVCPQHHVLFFANSTDVNTHATAGNHFIYYTPVYATVS